MIDLSGDEAINRRYTSKQFERINRADDGYYQLPDTSYACQNTTEVEKLIRFLCASLTAQHLLTILFMRGDYFLRFFLARTAVNHPILIPNAKGNCLIFWQFQRFIFITLFKKKRNFRSQFVCFVNISINYLCS